MLDLCIRYCFATVCTLTKQSTTLSQADGTTLGADNGIGVAATLALLDSSKDAKLPPIEALFTVVRHTILTLLASYSSCLTCNQVCDLVQFFVCVKVRCTSIDAYLSSGCQVQEEEIGLRGAFALDASLLTGRTMLNLDTEEAGQVYIGCAGNFSP